MLAIGTLKLALGTLKLALKTHRLAHEALLLARGTLEFSSEVSLDLTHHHKCFFLLERGLFSQFRADF